MPSRSLWLWFPLWLRDGGDSLRLGDGPGMVLWLVGWCPKWQSKTLFLMIFHLRSSIVLTFSIAAYLV